MIFPATQDTVFIYDGKDYPCVYQLVGVIVPRETPEMSNKLMDTNHPFSPANTWMGSRRLWPILRNPEFHNDFVALVYVVLDVPGFKLKAGASPKRLKKWLDLHPWNRLPEGVSVEQLFTYYQAKYPELKALP